MVNCLLIIDYNDYKKVLQTKDALYAFALLRDCSPAMASGQMQNTRPDGKLLTAPTLQLRCNAVVATALVLQNLLPGDLNTQTHTTVFLCSTSDAGRKPVILWLQKAFVIKLHGSVFRM